MPISKLLPNVNSSKLLGRVNIFSAPITKLEIKIKNNDIKPDRLANLHSKTKFYDMKPDRLANLQNKYYYFMGRGNNSQVVDEVMSKRIWWIKEENVTGKNINFIWQQHSKGIPWERFSDKHPNEIPIVFNHFEFIYEIGTKNLLMKNLIEYCSIHDIYVYNFVPLTMEIKLEENLEIDLKLFHKIHTHICNTCICLFCTNKVTKEKVVSGLKCVPFVDVFHRSWVKNALWPPQQIPQKNAPPPHNWCLFNLQEMHTLRTNFNSYKRKNAYKIFFSYKLLLNKFTLTEFDYHYIM